MSLTTSDRFFIAHADYERHNPEHAAYARRVDPDREFPCPGSIRIVDQTEHLLILACDACRFETTCRASRHSHTAPF